jgi:hypothetical protein
MLSWTLLRREHRRMHPAGRHHRHVGRLHHLLVVLHIGGRWHELLLLRLQLLLLLLLEEHGHRIHWIELPTEVHC